MTYQVRFTREAERDLLGLYDFLADRDPRAAKRALVALRKAFELLGLFPFSCRKAEGADSALVREMVVAFGARGYVILFEIDDSRTVTVLAVRHQRESDYR